MPENTPAVADASPESQSQTDSNQTATVAAAGTGATAEKPPVPEGIRRANDAAVAGTVHTPRRIGQRGPDKRPRKRPVSMGPVGDGPPAASLEDARQAVLPVDFEPDRAAVDLVATEKIVAGIVSQLNAGVGAVVYLLGVRWIGDREIAKAARESSEMSDEEKASLTSSGAYMWQKYLGSIADPKEAAFYIVLAGWLGLKVGGSVLSLHQAGQARKASAQHLPKNTAPE